MASLKRIRKRITSVKSTQKITKAMKMIAAVKLRRAQVAATDARPYAEKLGELLRHVAARTGPESHPLLATREEVRAIDVIVVTSDRGLCGGYNTNLIQHTIAFLTEHAQAHVRLTIVGNKGLLYFRKRPVDITESHTQLPNGPDHALATQIAGRVARDSAAAETDAVYLIYNQFRSVLSQVPTTQRLLPIPPADLDAQSLSEYLYEPDPDALLDRLLWQYVTTSIDQAFLEAIASEHAARMTAMESATSNASDMIDRLTLEMNRARQATITTELMEIVSGAEALSS